MSVTPIYIIRDDPKCDRVFARLFTEPGILVLREFPVTQSRFNVLRQSYSYDEIVDEIRYCIGSRESAERLARWIIDDLLLEEAAFMYPELIRPAIEASIATVVNDRFTQQRLLMMFPAAPIFYLPDDDYGPVIKAFDALKKYWKLPGNFPRHLRPLEERVKDEKERRLGTRTSAGHNAGEVAGGP